MKLIRGNITKTEEFLKSFTIAKFKEMRNQQDNKVGKYFIYQCQPKYMNTTFSYKNKQVEENI